MGLDTTLIAKIKQLFSLCHFEVKEASKFIINQTKEIYSRPLIKCWLRRTLLIGLIIVAGGFFYFNNFKSRPTQAAVISGSAFTATSYDLSATGVSYTITFTLPSALNAANADYIRVGIAGLAGGGTVGADFCQASVNSITITNNASGGSLSSTFQASPENNGRCADGIIAVDTGTIDAGAIVTLVLDNITNPSGEGAYYPDVTDTQSNGSNAQSMPWQAFGTPLLKIKVTDPTGSTGINAVNVWVYSNDYVKNAGGQTDILGNIFLFASNFMYPSGDSVDGTYNIQVMTPSGNVYTDAATISSVNLASGSTVDYTQAPLGPIKLTRPQLTGTLKVPTGCSTCQASAGDVIPNAAIDAYDSSFSHSNFKHTMSDSSGVFRLGGLSAGTYTIEFRMPYNQQNYLGLIQPAALTNFVVNEDGSVTYNSNTTAASDLPVDLGDVEFRLASKTISGKVTKTDGTAVEGVLIRAFKMMDSGMAQTTTDSNGDYSLQVGGGTWMLMPEIDFSANFDNDSNNDVSADWVYCGRPKSVSFADDTSSETSTGNNFEVKTADVTITGKVVLPNGSPLSGNASVNIFSQDGCGSYAATDYATGTFSARVPAGTYTITIYTWSSDYASPSAVTVTADSGTVDVGTLSLIAKEATISGRLWADTNGNGSYDSGEGVGNIRVEAFKMSKKFDEFAGGPGGGMGGGDWASAISSNTEATKGNYSIKVTPGTWVVNVMADPGMMSGGYSSTSVNYIYSGAPQQVSITTSTQTSTGHNFELKVADATIQGRIVDAETGEGISGIWGYAFAESNNSFNQGPMMGMGMGAPINNSSFTLKVPAGTYRVGIDIPSDTAGYTASDMVTVAATAGETTTVDVGVVANNATIRVQFKDTDGNLITNLSYAEVFLDNGGGGHQWKSLSASDLTNGYVDINVAPGNWRVGYHIDPTNNNYMSESESDALVIAIANQTVTRDITLRAADSTVSGTVYDPNGNPLAGVWVSTDSRKTSNFSPGRGPMFMQGAMTGSDGTYTLNLPSGTYRVAAFFPPSAVVNGQTVTYLNPEPQEVTISPTSSATVNFNFTQSDATITGTVTLNGNPQGAFVVGYSDAGGYNETTTTNGNYSLAVTKDDTWYVRAMYETGNTFYMSSIKEVAMGGASGKTQNLSLNAANFTIPDAVSATFNCANSKKITLSNGAEISIPASAITPSSVSSCSSSDSNSNITVTITPTAQMSLQDKSIPIGVGYEITAKDSNGSAISTTFNSNATITIPYNETQITESLGSTVDESLLGNGYWDTSTSTWRSVSTQVLDTSNNKLTISTNHFTLFGILAASDPVTSEVSTSSATSSSGSEGSSTRGAGTSDPLKPWLTISQVSNSPYQAGVNSYVHLGGDLVIKGRAAQDAKIYITIDDQTKPGFYAGPGSKWEYIIFDPHPGHKYQIKIYAENNQGERSKIYSLIVQAASQTKTKQPSTSTTPKLSPVSADDFALCNQTYVVQAGDSWWRIAAQELGNGAWYPVLQSFNSNIIHLHPKQVLEIPCAKDKETDASGASPGEERLQDQTSDKLDEASEEVPDFQKDSLDSEQQGANKEIEESVGSKMSTKKSIFTILSLLIVLGTGAWWFWLKR